MAEAYKARLQKLYDDTIIKALKKDPAHDEEEA